MKNNKIAVMCFCLFCFIFCSCTHATFTTAVSSSYKYAPKTTVAVTSWANKEEYIRELGTAIEGELINLGFVVLSQEEMLWRLNNAGHKFSKPEKILFSAELAEAIKVEYLVVVSASVESRYYSMSGSMGGRGGYSSNSSSGTLEKVTSMNLRIIDKMGITVVSSYLETRGDEDLGKTIKKMMSSIQENLQITIP